MFTTAYPEMPPFNNLYQFTNPITGTQGDSIRYIINALFIHQFGKPHTQYRNLILNDTPNQTINKIKSMLVGQIQMVDYSGLKIKGAVVHMLLLYINWFKILPHRISTH